MVVLSAAVTTKAGKFVLSRQYREMSRIRIEGLLMAFPKLINTNQQHTYVETNNVRYIYQPVETLYVLLITTKNSNIVEDLDTLRLLCRVLSEYAPKYGIVDEDSIVKSTFDIVYAFDEVIDWGGLRENVNLQQIATLTEMYSKEECVVKMVRETKIAEAKEERKRREAEIRRQRNEGKDRFSILGNEIGKILQAGGMGAIAKDLGFTGTGSKTSVSASYAASGGISFDSYSQQSMGIGGAMGGGLGINAANVSMGMGIDRVPTSSSYSRNSVLPPVSGTAAKKGMSLGKFRKQDVLLDSLRAEGEVVDAPVSRRKGAPSVATSAAQFIPPSRGVHLITTEKISLSVSRDGGIQSMEVKGDLLLRISDASKAAIFINVSTGDAEANGIQFRTHPNVDRTLFSSKGLIGFKDSTKPFPVGNALGVLRWQLVTKDEKKSPLIINCWPSDNGAESVVNIEYELGANKELRDVNISVPIGSGSQPTVSHCDGEFVYSARTQICQWRLPLIDETNSQGSLEFSTALANSNSFFPITVSFSSKYTYAPVTISRVTLSGTGENIDFAHESLLVSEIFAIV